MILSKLNFIYLRNYSNIENPKNNNNDSILSVSSLLYLENLLIDGNTELFKNIVFGINLKKSNKFKKIYFYYLVIAYFNLMKDEFNYNKSIYELSKIDLKISEFLNDYFKSDLIEIRISLVNKYNNDLIEIYKKYPFLNDIIINLYLHIYLCEEFTIKNLAFERKIKFAYKRISNLKKINSFHLQKIYIIGSLIDNYFMMRNIINYNFFISFEVLKKLLLNALIFINKSDFILPSNFKDRINLLYNFKSSIFSIEIRKDNYSKDNEQIYENLFHKFRSYLNISNSIFDDLLLNNSIDINKFNTELSRLINTPGQVKILEFIATIIGISFKSGQVNQVKLVIEDKLNEVVKFPELEINIQFSLELINFWMNLPSDFSNPRYKIPNIIELLWRYERRFISFDELLKALDDAEMCFSLNIQNWKKLNDLFDEVQLPIFLLKFLKKINVVRNDVEIINFINKFLFDIISVNKYNNLFLKDFIELSKLCVVLTNYQIKTVYYIYVCFINMYHYKGEEIISFSNILIERFEELKLEKLENDKLITNLVVNVSSLLDSERAYKLFDIIKNLSTSQLTILSNICLNLNSGMNEKFLEKLDIFILYDILIEKYEIKEIEYELVVQIAQKLIIHKEKFNKILNFDVIYLFENKFYVIINNINIDFKNMFDFLNIGIINEINDNYERESLSSTIIQRIYFKYIEKFNVGYAISIGENLNPREIIEKLAKELDYNERKELIDKINGGNEIDEPWLNIFDAHKLFKIINGDSDSIYMFKNSITRYLPTGSILLSFSSLLLLSRLNMLDKIINIENVFITKTSYETITEYSINNHFHFEDVLEGFVFYKEMVDILKNAVDYLYNMKKVIDFSNENLLPDLDLNFINKYDRDVFNFILINTYNNKDYTIINDDPYFLKLFKNYKNFQSTLSFLIYMFQLKLVDSNYIYEKINEMKKINYKTTIEGEALSFLILNIENEMLEKIINVSN